MKRKNAKRLGPKASVAERPAMEMAPTASGSPPAVPLVVEQLVALQRRRRFCIKSQSRCDRSIEALIARDVLGYQPPRVKSDDPAVRAKERGAAAKIFKQASTIRKEVEGRKGGIKCSLSKDHGGRVPPSVIILIVVSAHARGAFDTVRAETEKEMRRLARLLPVWPAARTLGFSDLMLAVVVAEAPGWHSGGLGDFPTYQKLWKRLGLAVIAGERQQKKSNVDEALLHAYSPARRAEIYAVVGIPLFMGSKKNGLHESYSRRRAHTASTHPEWSKPHADSDARRYITKAAIKSLWKAWRRCESTAPMKLAA